MIRGYSVSEEVSHLRLENLLGETKLRNIFIIGKYGRLNSN